VNKKKQKNLVNLINCELSEDRQGNQMNKSFLLLFFKKEDFPFLPARPGHPFR